MAKKTNVQKIAEILNAEYDFLSDGSGSYVSIENKTHVVCISFDGKGEILTDISIAKKIYKVVNEEIIAQITLVEEQPTTQKTKSTTDYFINAC